MGKPIRIAIADDHALFREGLRAVLNLHDEVEVTAEAERVDDVGPMVERTGCEVLLLDLQMDRSTLPEIESLAKRVKVLVVTASELPADAQAAIRAGARGVVYKRFALQNLIQAIQEVSAGRMWIPPSLQSPGH